MSASLSSVGLAALCLVFGLILVGCGGDEGAGASATKPPPYTLGCDASAPPTRTASCIESFTPGEDAGFGEAEMPDIIYDEPLGNGDTAGSLDVLSLGRFGSIVVGFGGNTITDLAGPDFTVFENAFFAAGDPNNVFAELGEISVSMDGENWSTFPCNKDAKPPTGCAGYAPVFANRDLGISAFDPMVSGGDLFDLADIGVTEARFVRIRDVEGKGGAPSAGFDLDAVGIVNAGVKEP